MEIPTIYINSEKAAAIKAKRHPWIFDGALVSGSPTQTSGPLIKASAKNGALVRVSAKNGTEIGYGLYCAFSKIRVRMLSFGEAPLPDTWLKDRIEAAFRFRETLAIDSNAYRLVNGEGDFLPGLVIDLYNQTIVVRPFVKYFEDKIDELVSILSALLPGKSIFLKRDEHAVRNEHLEAKNGYILGQGNGFETIEENQMHFNVDIANGQKTGFYLDQRENRSIFKGLCEGKSVCNLFSYTGAFSIAAAQGGASKVLSIDSSEGAIKLGKENADLNADVTSSIYEWQCEDVFSAIDKLDSYDMIVLDPPPFARKKSEVEGAVKGYRHLNERAFRLVNTGGFLFTFSCSGAVSKELFQTIVFEAGLKTGRSIRIVEELQAGSDHAVSLYHPEGEYLKGLILYVE
jgi:23S rRNA (cytosine1962-C5)-methyltransferase